MRKSSKSSKGPLKMEPAPPSAGMDDVKVKAVNEMMERIKHGVVLRPVKGQDTKRFGIKPPPAGEEKQQESAMEELKGILETVKRSPSRGFPEAPPSKRDSELEVILRRRRKQACDATVGDEKDSEISKVSSSESLNARHSSDSGKEAWGPRRGGSTRSSSSDKGISELFANGSCDSGEEEKTNEEKPAPAEANGENDTVLNQEKQAMLTPGSPDGVSPLIGGTDAEC